MPNPIEFVKQHPVEVGIGVVALGLLYFMLNSGGSSSGSTDASLGAAYYSALAQQSQDSTALAIAQTQGTATTAQTQIAADAYTSVQNTWAGTDLAETQSNNNAAVSAAPYAAEAEAISTLGQVASLPPTTTTTTKGGSSGFFGLFGSGPSSTTTVTPNANASSASNALDELVNGLYSQH